ncbi:MAG: PmoA family protein [Verrucomicrobia bacterium]|jgi:hypothetical protein|nr:PmoA family protein [Verrucomicrobiota bacterium]
MKTRWFILGLAAIPLLSVQAKTDLAMTVHEDRGEIEIRLGEKPLFVYAFATNQLKPYLRELYTLGGENVLLDAPPDHLHHHGLMYAVRVNGVNFWEEKDAPGVEKPVKLLAHSVGKSAAGLSQAKFKQLIHWLAPTNRSAANSKAVALLIEQRTLTLTVDERNREVALQWDAAFEVGQSGKVTLHGTDYNGLGLRLPQSFDHVAAFQNSEKSPYVGPKSRDNIPARWTSVTGKTGTGEVTLALFGKTTNPGGNTVFFTLLEPFAYLSATQGLDKKPLEYAAGDKFRLSYLLTVFSEPRAADVLPRCYEAWAKAGN